MFSMFGGGDDGRDAGPMIETPLPMVAEVGRRERLAWEKEAIGVFLSDHPFMDAARWLRAGRSYTVTSAISAEHRRRRRHHRGIVAAVRRITTRKGDTMAVATLEDLHGSVEVVGFPRTFQETAELWREDAILIVQGKVDARDDRLQIIAEGLEEWTPDANSENIADEDVVQFQPTVVVAPASTARGDAPRRQRPPRTGTATVTQTGMAIPTGTATRMATGTRRRRSWCNDCASPMPADENEVADSKRLERLSHLLQDEGGSPYEIVVAIPEGRFRVSAPESRGAPDRRP